MDTLTALDAAALSALDEHVGRLKHDLGKYVAMQQRWQPRDADASSVLEALRTDLLETRRGPDGSVDAASVWAEFRPALFGEVELSAGVQVDLSQVSLVRELDEAMAVVRDVTEALRTETAGPEERAAGAAAALEVSDLCRQLARTVRAALRSRKPDEPG